MRKEARQIELKARARFGSNPDPDHDPDRNRGRVMNFSTSCGGTVRGTVHLSRSHEHPTRRADCQSALLFCCRGAPPPWARRGRPAACTMRPNCQGTCAGSRLHVMSAGRSSGGQPDVGRTQPDGPGKPGGGGRGVPERSVGCAHRRAAQVWIQCSNLSMSCLSRSASSARDRCSWFRLP